MKIEIVKYEDGYCAIRKRDILDGDAYMDLQAYLISGRQSLIWYSKDNVVRLGVIYRSEHKAFIDEAFGDACKREDTLINMSDDAEVIESVRIGSFLGKSVRGE